MKRRVHLLYAAVLAAAALVTACASGVTKSDVRFSYGLILKKEYRLDVGRVIPVTIEQAIETDGEFTPDGAYLFFASNRERGNFDIYLRSLTGISTARLTGHPSKDTSPAVSPDGAYLAYVSQREDPEGDIYVAEIDPAKLLESAAVPGKEAESVDKKSINLTQIIDPALKSVKSIRDASPSWSPDGRWIVYSSSKDGAENLWIMDRRGRKARQLTRHGGMYPRFSADGKSIVYISYRDEGGNGDVYILNLDSGGERRVTATPAVELNPSFGKSPDEIYYTLIDRDTNGDGSVTLQDNAILYYRNLKTKREYPLTPYSQSSFSPRWSKVYDGVVVYSNQAGENININVIPDEGVIPRRENATRQYELAERYLKEHDDTERYLMCLERVYYYFGTAGDSESVVSTARALSEAARAYLALGKKGDAARLQALLASLSKTKSDYRGVMARYLSELLDKRPGAPVLLESLEELRKDRSLADAVPYLLEDLADEYSRLGRRAEAVASCRQIIASYPKYRRLIHVHLKNALLSYTALSGEIHPSYIEVLDSNYIFQKNDAYIQLLEIFQREKDVDRRLSLARDMLIRYRQSRTLPAVLQYEIGRALAGKGDMKQAKERLTEASRLSGKEDLVYYKTSVMLGDIAARMGNWAEFESSYAAAANNYRLRWRQADVRTVVGRLIDHYEGFGESAEYSGSYAEAAALYKKYVRLLTYLNLVRGFDDIYNRYAARANVLYIDAYAAAHGDDPAKLEAIADEYSNRKRMDVARLDRDKAHMYGLAYIYTKIALAVEKKAGMKLAGAALMKGGAEGLLENFRKAASELDWALFIDDTFIDPYLLYGWIYQYVDLRRKDDQRDTGGKNEAEFSRFFPRYLWERNIDLYRKALDTNNESENPGKEGNLHLNIANTFFLLSNYPRALQHYEQVPRFKRAFNSRIEEAMFHYHLGYCYFQTGAYGRSRDEMRKTLIIYRTLSAGGNTRLYKHQVFSIYRFFALLYRLEKNYPAAVEWFNRVLEFAADHSIRVDRARYFQEIAHCLKEMGDTARAAAYLERAEALLKKYPESETRYNLTARFFGLGPIPFWDLGPDVAVIGDNRIYTKLDTNAKRLLNLSMQEEICHARGDDARSLEYLERKLEALKKPRQKSDRDARLRTLNNIGFACFRMRDYGKARRVFGEAWDYASSPGVNDMEGAFTAIVNLSNLYAHLAENRITAFREPLSETDRLIARITAYRTEYESARYAAEAARLEEDAKKERRKIKPEELESAREKIRRESGDVYYSIDIVLSVLKFYKAGQLAENARPKGRSAFGTYEINREMYELYASARRGFEAALDRASGEKSKRLMVKLLLNVALCQETTGYIREAYDSLTAAGQAAGEYAYTDLEWRVHGATAGFLVRHGAAVAGNGYMNMAREHYRNALAQVEELPWLYSVSLARIVSLYEEYADMLLRLGDWKAALPVLEREYQTERIMRIHTASAQFSDHREQGFFSGILDAASRIDAARREISALREAGEAGDSKKLAKLVDDIRAGKNRISAAAEETRRYDPVFASLIAAVPGDIPGTVRGTALRFFRSGHDVHAWKATGGSVEYRKFTAAPGAASYDDIAGELSRFAAAPQSIPEAFFIVMDAHSMVLLGSPGLRERLPPFTFVSSFERTKYYASGEAVPLPGVFVLGKRGTDELIPQRERARLIIASGAADGPTLSRYPVIVDAGDSLGPNLLFSYRVGAQLLIKSAEIPDPGEMRFLAEAALYSGIPSLVVCPAGRVASVLDESLRLPVDRLGAGAYAFGFHGGDAVARNAGAARAKESWLAGYHLAYNGGDMARAKSFLYRWKQLAGTGSATEAEFHLKLAEIETAAEDYKAAAETVERAMRISQGTTPGVYARALAYRVYLYLYQGDIHSAKTLMAGQGIPGDFISSGDRGVFDTVADIAARGAGKNPDALKLFNPKNKFFLPRLRLRLLLAEYLGIQSRYREAKEIAAGAEPDTPLSPRERCALALLGRRATPATGPDDRVSNILALEDDLADARETVSRAQLAVQPGGAYDRLSAAALKAAVARLMRGHRLAEAYALYRATESDDIIRASYWMDAVALFSLMQNVFSLDEKPDDSLEAAETVLALLKGKGMQSLESQFLRHASRESIRLGKFRESADYAERGRALGQDTDRFGLLLMEAWIAMGDLKKAGELGDSIKVIPAGADACTLDLLKARLMIARAVRNKSASEEDWKRITALVRAALEYLDSSAGAITEYDRVDLAEQGLDFVISYRLSRNDYLGALLYSEVKQHLRLRSKLISPPSFPAPVVKEFKNLADRVRDRERFMTLLRRHPGLPSAAFPAMLPVEEFQKSLPDTAVALYLVKNESDIFCWAIAPRFISPVRIRNGYSQISQLRDTVRADLSALRNTAGISRTLSSVFKPLETYYKTVETVVFITDRELEWVPFELVGEKKPLDDSHTLVFFPSIMSGLRGYERPAARLAVHGVSSMDAISYLEQVAIGQSGIHRAPGPERGPVFTHLFTAVSFDPVGRQFLADSRPLGDMIVPGQLVYLAEAPALGNTGLAQWFSSFGAKGMIVNDAAVHDVNSAVFVNGFYSGIAGGADIISAFRKARAALKQREEFRHPAYWSGIRLYLSGFR